MKNVIVSIAPAAHLSASGNGAGVDLRPYSGHALLYLDASATEAADNTLDVKLQHSDDNVTFVDAGVAFDQVTNAAAARQAIELNVDRFKRYVRAVDTLAGTTPKVSRAVVLVAKPDRS